MGLNWLLIKLSKRNYIIMAFYWTEDAVQALKQLWQQGYSARQIADKIGGVSRNAVIGKAHRLGLSQRLALPKRTYLPKQLLREKTCQWPMGEPTRADFYFCAEMVVNGKPYCQSHCLRAYRRLALGQAMREINHEIKAVIK